MTLRLIERCMPLAMIPAMRATSALTAIVPSPTTVRLNQTHRVSTLIEGIWRARTTVWTDRASVDFQARRLPTSIKCRNVSPQRRQINTVDICSLAEPSNLTAAGYYDLIRAPIFRRPKAQAAYRLDPQPGDIRHPVSSMTTLDRTREPSRTLSEDGFLRLASRPETTRKNLKQARKTLNWKPSKTLADRGASLPTKKVLRTH